jgi:hypothetical protein
MSDWSDEETDDPIHADRRNFYKVEKWSRDGQRIAEMVFAGSSLDKACRIFERMTKHRPSNRSPCSYQQVGKPGSWGSLGSRRAVASNLSNLWRRGHSPTQSCVIRLS